MIVLSTRAKKTKGWKSELQVSAEVFLLCYSLETQPCWENSDVNNLINEAVEGRGGVSEEFLYALTQSVLL